MPPPEWARPGVVWASRRLDQAARALRGAAGAEEGGAQAEEDPQSGAGGVAPTLARSPSEDSLTPSIRDLFDHGPGLVEGNSWKAFFCLHLGRILASNVGDCKLLPRENKTLIQEMSFGNRAAQFSSWRFSLLATGVLFFAFITTVEVLMVADIWQMKGGDSIVMRRIDPRYRKFFDGLHICNWVQSVGFMLASVAAVFFAALAVLQWKKMRWSRRWAMASFMSSYMPPFLLLLVIPFRNSVDFEGIQVQLCQDMLNLTLSAQPETAVQVWPGQVGDLAKTLFDSYSIKLPSNFCDGKPTEWGSRIRAHLEGQGVLARADGTCSFADNALRTLRQKTQADLSAHNMTVSFSALSVAVGVSQANCPTACLNCTSVCLPHLMRLTALASIHGAASLRGLSLGGVAEHCTHCVSQDSGLLCQFRCQDITAQLDQQAILGVIPSSGKACFKANEVRDFELLMQMGTQTAYWKLLLGTIYAALSLATLLPLAFTLMLGAAKGASIAKSLIPYSRVPTVISTAAAVFTFPFVFMITILVQNAVGTWLTLVGIILMLIAFLASMKPGSLRAESSAEMMRRQNILGKVGLASALLAVIVFLVVFGVSDVADLLYNVLKDQGLQLTNEDLRTLGSQTTWMLVNTICTIFGKSLISTVFFSDSVVKLMYRFHRGEDEDAFSVQCARAKLVDDLDTVFRLSQAVVPSENTSSPSVSPGELADQHKAEMMLKVKSATSAGKLASRMKELERVQARIAVRKAAQRLGWDSSEASAAARHAEGTDS